MGGQLLAEVPHLAPVTGQLLTQTLARPGAGVQRPLELKWPMWTCVRLGIMGDITFTELLQGAGRGGLLYLLTTVLMVSTQVSSSFWSEVWKRYSALSQVSSLNTNCFLV